MDQTLASAELQIERKHITIEFRENPRGRFLRITEEAHGRRNTVIVPGPGLPDFLNAIATVLTQAGESSSSAPAA